MFKKSLLTKLICLLILLFSAVMPSFARLQKKEQSAEEIKKRVESFGLGVNARVKVKLQSGAKMEGFIDTTGEEHFYLVRTDDESGTGDIIAYSNVARIESLEEKKSFLNWRKVIYRTGAGASALLSVLRNLYLQGQQIAPLLPL